jgi:RNA polymerase sigma-70 factor (ECF subfamily)
MANISTPKIARIRAALTSLHFRTPSRGGGFAGAMDDLDQWFAEQILPYEGALTAYLRRVWPDPSEIADLRQEVYVRVYQGAGKRRPPVARFFLFAIARNLLIDRLRKSRVVPIDLMEDLDAANVLSDDISADRIISGRQELARLEAALGDLPERCRETFVLRKIDELSQRETAGKMGVSEATVEKQMVKAMRILTDRFWNAASRSGKRPDDGKADGDEKRR